MKIAQIAPLIEGVPPRLYGGTERVVSYLTEELVALGHDVTLFASGDLITAANLVPCVPCMDGARGARAKSGISAKRSGAAMYPAFECSRCGRWP